jgi:RNA polymerase sigma factor (sigma-70 family)
MPPQESRATTLTRPAATPPSLAEVFDAARAGDQRAWSELVQRVEPTLRSVVRRYGLTAAEADDVLQIGWMRLFENLGTLRAPEAVASWLIVAVRREAFRVLQSQVREYLTGDSPLADAADGVLTETAVLNAERREVLSQAMATLPERHRRLMHVLLTRPDLDYNEVSASTGVPRGSIGPIRGRCLARMAGDPAVQALRD